MIDLGYRQLSISIVTIKVTCVIMMICSSSCVYVSMHACELFNLVMFMRVCTPPQGEAEEVVGLASTRWVGLMQRLVTLVPAVTENRIVTLSERIGEFGGGA